MPGWCTSGFFTAKRNGVEELNSTGTKKSGWPNNSSEKLTEQLEYFFVVDASASCSALFVSQGSSRLDASQITSKEALMKADTTVAGKKQAGSSKVRRPADATSNGRYRSKRRSKAQTKLTRYATTAVPLLRLPRIYPSPLLPLLLLLLVTRVCFVS